MIRFAFGVISLGIFILSCGDNPSENNRGAAISEVGTTDLLVSADENNHAIYIGTALDPALITHVVKDDHRPYLHPVKAPDGNGVLTEFSPSHHRHQTGIYWGFTRMNGRDYFHHPEGTYWQKESASILQSSGPEVKWQSVYNLLNENGETIMQETQIWSAQAKDGKYLLDLEWRGLAKKDITIEKYDYGGLFVRMPWKKGMEGEVMNAARQKNERAEGQQAMWVDVGMKLEGRSDWAHIAVLDHPHNASFPQTWRVDNQLGIGPARSRTGDWQIEEGNSEIIKHRLICYTGELNDVTMTDQWNDYIGNHSLYSDAVLWGIAQKEGRTAEFLTPEKAVDQMTITDGFEVNVWVAEPDITQPMAFCWDDQGRLWVAENRDYESRGYGFSNGGDSRILILEDTDGDGKADSRKVFAEGIPFPAGLAVGFDGVFVGAPPNLLFIPDKDRDDKADMADIEVRLTGWGIRDRHETLNSFHWGPDGWLYGTEGFATPSKVRKPNGKGKLYSYKEAFPEDLLEAEGVDIDGGVWRYHPTKDKFEVVAHGFSNPWGIDYDAKGQFFITACVIPHMFHIINGGIYHRQGGKHFNPYVYSDIQTIVDHRHRSAHGGARVYQSDAFPPEYQGQLFMANIHEHAVLVDKLIPKGSGYVASHGSDFMMANNAQWVGFSMEIGPDGGVYVLDWHDADICGKEVVNKETGRVFRIMPKKSLAKDFPGRRADLKKMSDEELVDLQSSSSDWHSRRSRVVLQSRAAAGNIKSDTKELIKKRFTNANSINLKLRYLWSNFIIDGWTDTELISMLSDSDPHIRSWAAQFLMEKENASEGIKKALVNLAKNEKSPVTRLTLASVLQRIDHEDRWQMAEALLQYGEDQEDHNIPKMLWFGIEPLIGQDAERGLQLAGQSKIDHVTRCIARRIVDAGQMDVLVAELLNHRPSIKPLLEGLRESLEGMASGNAPEGWDRVYSDLSKDSDFSDLAMEIAQKFGNAEVAQTYLASLQNSSTSIPDKISALKGLAEQQNIALIELLPELITDRNLGITALQAIANYDERSLGRAIGDHYESLSDAQKEQAILTMASRPQYGQMLTSALDKGLVPKSDVPAYVARQLRRVVGNGFVEVWGPIDLVSSDVDATYAKYRSLLSSEALALANHSNGKEVFQKVCASCHQLYGSGGLIGPDITGSNRTDLEYLLSNLIEPSFDIQDDYKMTIITTQDGRTHIGTVAVENDRQVTLRVVGQDPMAINKSNIQSREQGDASMMPVGLLNTVSDQEVIDLIGYLQLQEDVDAGIDAQ